MENFMLAYPSSGIMKKARPNYPCQDMYIKNSINSNMRNQTDTEFTMPLDPAPVWQE